MLEQVGYETFTTDHFPLPECNQLSRWKPPVTLYNRYWADMWNWMSGLVAHNSLICIDKWGPLYA